MKSNKILLKLLPYFFLLVVELILFLTNYTPGTYLIGWDNIMPEFNFKLNLWRNLFAIWQEYRGLGLLDGMSQAANLPHTLFLYLLSLFFTKNLLRYVFTFLMHFLGGLGIYILLKNEMLQNNKNKIILSLTGSLFYLFNATTVQMFYTPLEAFSLHFAAIPWLVLTFNNYLKSGKRRDLFWFLIVTFLSTPQFFVTPLFIISGIVLGCIGLIYFNQIKRTIFGIMCFLLINSFWLLPYLYSVPYNGTIISQAKINQISSQEVYLLNQAFGDVKNVLLMRGFSLDYTDLVSDSGNGFMMQAWRTHLFSPFISIIYTVFVLTVLLGLIKLILVTFNNKKRYEINIYLPFMFMFGISFLFLANDTPILREINDFIRNYIPLFGEAFRFAFTKFSLLYTFSYTVLFVFGLKTVAALITKNNKNITAVLSSVIIIIIIYTSWPSFSGNFIYKNLRVSLPDEYFRLFDFMTEQNPDGRTALLPEFDYWSWKFYQFGIRGSGFMWYGIPQPTMDQAFTPWSRENENYYWELSKALYSKRPVDFENVLKKYDIQFLIHDENIMTVNDPMALYTNEIKILLQNNPQIIKKATFGRITVYQYNGLSDNSYVSLIENIPIIGPTFRWNDNDVVFNNFGNYISSDKNTQIYFPFRSLFTKRSIDEREFNVSENANEINISVKAPVKFLNLFPDSISTGSAVVRKSTEGLEAIIPKNDNLVFDSNKTYSLNQAEVKPCSPFREGTSSIEVQNDGDKKWLHFTDNNHKSCLSFGMPDLAHREGYLVAVDSRHITGRPLQFGLINQTAKHLELETQLSNTTDWQTNYFILPPLASDGLTYNVYLTNDAIGRYKTENDISRIRVIRIPYSFLTSLKIVNPNYQLSTINSQLSSVSHPNPAEYFVNITNSQFNNETIEQSNNVITLYQSYNDGWQAFSIDCQMTNVQCQIKKMFPYIFGHRLKDHVLVNNWSNGWILSNQELDAKRYTLNANFTIYLVFWPQVLEFFGFGLLLLPFLYIFRKR